MTAITHKLEQAYRQAPWRTQVQWSGMFLMVLISIVMIAGLYLSISAQAATAGLDIQDLQVQKDETTRRSADLRNQLAYLTSDTVMAARAKELGYKLNRIDEPTYLIIPNYAGREKANLAPPPGLDMIPSPVLRPAYTQSLWEWLFQGVLSYTDPSLGVQP
jgi:cell division protein FtsL